MKKLMRDGAIREILGRGVDETVAVFIEKRLKKHKINGRNLLVISDANVLRGLANEGYFDCIVSSAALNDYVRMNESLTKVHRLLNHGGLFVGNVETNEQFGMRMEKKYNIVIARVVQVFGFLFRRVIPKLSGFRLLHEKFGIFRHHMLSKCEALGRLRFNGFEFLALQEINNRLHFVVRKSSVPLNGPPCDGLLIKIKKVGLNGSPLYCYKLRTMHSYANYLHDYILGNLRIDNNGKVVGDFRVPGWGRIFRKMWLDEMPQLLNILKGELTFIGLRHLSSGFLQLYPEDWRNERMKLRPGFVPPYYADCPKTFEGIIESEKKYYRLKKKYPITTDVYYFVRVVISFLTMKARTG
jgi:hypothetical protein